MFRVIEVRLNLEEPVFKPVTRIVAVKSSKTSAQAHADRMNHKQDLQSEGEALSYYVSTVSA